MSENKYEISKYIGTTSSSNSRGMRANPQADTSALEQEIDALVYQLYGLTAEEIKVVEGK